VKREPETNMTLPTGGGAPIMTRDPRHPRRWLLAAGVYATVFLIGESHPADAASAEDCRTFHQECTEARGAGYSEVGICNVEQLECAADRDVSVPEPLHERGTEMRTKPERAAGERSSTRMR